MNTVSVNVPTPSKDSVSDMLRRLTREIHERGLAEKNEGCFGGEYGYGCDYENDVFLMHPYCWCDEKGCPWCAWCSGSGRDEPHREDCYSTRLAAIRKRHGDRSIFTNVAYGKERTALCVEMGLDPERGSEVHCTCDREERVSACDCDFHQGRGDFRFGKGVENPNFWHKPTGVRVRWYKYIGRCMEIELHGAPFDVAAVERSVVESLGGQKADP
jgi:hypothetical protein